MSLRERTPAGMALIHALRRHLPGGMTDTEARLDACTFVTGLVVEEMTAAA